jgi:hypothetical protein
MIVLLGLLIAKDLGPVSGRSRRVAREENPSRTGTISTPKKDIESKKVDGIRHRPCTQRIELLTPPGGTGILTNRECRL